MLEEIGSATGGRFPEGGSLTACHWTVWVKDPAALVGYSRPCTYKPDGVT